MSRIRQHHRTEIDGRLSRIDRPAKTFLHQSRNPAAVIEMGVRENNRIDLTRRNRRVLPVPFAPFFLSLKEPAVNQNLNSLLAARIVGGVDQMLRTSHRPSRAEKLDIGQDLSLRKAQSTMLSAAFLCDPLCPLWFKLFATDPEIMLRRNLKRIVRHIALRNTPVIDDDLDWSPRQIDARCGRALRAHFQPPRNVAAFAADRERNLGPRSPQILQRDRDHLHAFSVFHGCTDCTRKSGSPRS